MLIARTAALIVVMYAFLFNGMRMHQNSRPQICYGPLRVKDEEWKNNLDRIYNYNDIKCVSMLHMRRAPFFKAMQLACAKNLL
jgi:hypothetical protein